MGGLVTFPKVKVEKWLCTVCSLAELFGHWIPMSCGMINREVGLTKVDHPFIVSFRVSNFITLLTGNFYPWSDAAVNRYLYLYLYFFSISIFLFSSQSIKLPIVKQRIKWNRNIQEWLHCPLDTKVSPRALEREVLDAGKHCGCDVLCNKCLHRNQMHCQLSCTHCLFHISVKN